MKDEYKCVKVLFKHICKKDTDYDVILDAVKRVNRMVTLCYQFMRMYILYQFEHNKDIPIINKNFIRMSFKALSKPSKGGRPPNENNKLIYDNLCKFYK